MNIPAKNGGKTSGCRHTFKSSVAVPVCLKYHRGTLDIFLQPCNCRYILREIRLQISKGIKSLIARWIQHISKPGIHAFSEISHCPYQEKQADSCDNFKYFLPCNHKKAVNSVSHSQPEKNIRLISQLKHGVGSCVSILINITHIYQFRNHHQSHGAKSHDNGKQVCRAHGLHKTVQAFVFHFAQLFPEH